MDASVNEFLKECNDWLLSADHDKEKGTSLLLKSTKFQDHKEVDEVLRVCGQVLNLLTELYPPDEYES